MNDKYLAIKEIAELVNMTKSPIKKRAKKENWPYRSYPVRGGKERRYRIADLPEDVQAAYASSIKASLNGLQSALKPPFIHEKKIVIDGYSGRGAKVREAKSLKQTPEKYLHVAATRLQLIEAYEESGLSKEKFIEAYNAGEINGELLASIGPRSQTTFYRWLEQYERDGLAGLAPQPSGARGGSGASLDEKAKDLIKALYLDPRKTSIKGVARNLKQHGYEIGYATIRRYVNDKIFLPAKIKYRQGEKAYKDRCEPHLNRDYNLIRSMQWGCGDHHIFDFVIKHEGRVFRPWLTMFIDMRSRKITGWHIDVVPNTLTIMRAFSMSAETCGLFEELLVDNGKDFRSEWFAGNEWNIRRTSPEKGTLALVKGVLQDCGTKVHFATPYKGQSKSIERAFRTIIELFSRENQFYVGSNTVDYPEYKKLLWRKINGRDRIEVTQTLEKLREDFAKFVAWFNACWNHSGQGMGGQTPDAVFAANLKEKREMPEDMRKYVFAVRERRTVNSNGVSIDGVEYYSEEMIQYFGSEVEVRRDINDAGKVYIFSLPDMVYRFEAVNDFFKDRGIPEENIRRLKGAQKKTRARLKDHVKNAEELRRGTKTPYEAYAEQHPGEIRAADERLVVNGVPLADVDDEEKKPLRICKETGKQFISILDRR